MYVYSLVQYRANGPTLGAFSSSPIRLTVCPSVCVPWRSCLGYRPAGCLQLSTASHQRCPRTDADPPRFLDRTSIGGAHIVSPPPGRSSSAFAFQLLNQCWSQTTVGLRWSVNALLFCYEFLPVNWRTTRRRPIASKCRPQGSHNMPIIAPIVGYMIGAYYRVLQ